MKINRSDNQFIATKNNQEAGYITFRQEDNNSLTLVHTEVHSDFRGQGVGQELLRFIVQQARDEHYKINILCPFIKAEMEKHPEYHDVLNKTEDS